MRKRFGIMLACVFAWTLALLCLTAPARAGMPGNSPTGFMAVWTGKQPDEKPEGIVEPEKEEEAEEEKAEEKEQDNTISFVLPAGLKIIVSGQRGRRSPGFPFHFRSRVFRAVRELMPVFDRAAGNVHHVFILISEVFS